MDSFTFCTWHQHGIAWIEHFARSYNYSSTMYLYWPYGLFVLSGLFMNTFDFFDFLVMWCPAKQKSKKAQKRHKSQKSILLIS